MHLQQQFLPQRVWAGYSLQQAAFAPSVPPRHICARQLHLTKYNAKTAALGSTRTTSPTHHQRQHRQHTMARPDVCGTQARVSMLAAAMVFVIASLSLPITDAYTLDTGKGSQGAPKTIVINKKPTPGVWPDIGNATTTPSSTCPRLESDKYTETAVPVQGFMYQCGIKGVRCVTMPSIL
jgi:hypothetical protein